MTMRLLAVDATNCVVRFAAAMIPNFSDLPDDAAVQQAPGVLAAVERAVLACAQEARCAHAVLALDSSAPLRRKGLYAAYKSNRTTRTTLWSDLAEIHFREIGMLTIRYPGEEADDIIATLAARVRDRGREMAILSGDGDLLQLARDGVECWQFGRKPEPRFVRRTPEWITHRYHEIASLDQLPVWKALAGDASDHLPGVKGIGAIRAARLLKEHPTAAAICEAMPDIADQLRLMLSLVTLRDDIPLDPINPAACRLVPGKPFESPATLSRADLDRLRVLNP